jgi:uncharacterized protein (UPF0332 family)
VDDLVFDPLDFLKLAEELSSETDEASWRTSISRAYYSMFLLAREEVKKRVSNNLDLKRAGSHQVIINTLKELQFYNIADKLNGLRLMRVNADYCLDININHDSVNKALQLAKDIYELIQLHMKSDTV